MYQYIVTVESEISGLFDTPMDTEERAAAFAALCLKNEAAEMKSGDIVTVTISKQTV